MNLFEERWFIGIIVALFISLLGGVWFFWCLIGIAYADRSITLINAIAQLLVTLLAISLPLYYAGKAERKRRKEEEEQVYRSIASYIGGEILDNLIYIQDVLANNRKTMKQIDVGRKDIDEFAKKRARAAIWRAAAADLSGALNDKYHLSMVKSGLMAKVKDRDVSSGIRETYQKMDNLISRLRHFTSFLNMLLDAPYPLPKPFIENQLNTKFPEGEEAIKLDMDIFKEQADETVVAINKMLKPYGQEIKIVTYEDELKEKAEKAKKKK